MKYIVTRTSCGNEETQPCPGAELTKLTIYRDVRFWETLEQFKKNCPSLFKDNPETGYTEKGQPFVILKRENLVWIINRRPYSLCQRTRVFCNTFPTERRISGTSGYLCN